MNYSYSSVRKHAGLYHQAGLQVLPIPYGGKRTAIHWKPLQTRPETDNFISSAFPDDDNNRNIAIVTGSISKNLLIMDFDNMQHYQELITKNDTFRNISQKTWQVYTHDGIHVYIYLNKPVKSSVIEDREIHLKGSGGYALAPTSQHPSGQLYLFDINEYRPILKVNYSDIQQCLDYELQIEDRTEYLRIDRCISTIEDLYLKNSNLLYGLSNASRDILSGEHKGYLSRSEAEHSVIVDAIGSGFDTADIKEVFRRYAYTGSKYHDQGESWLDHCINAAREHVNTHRNAISRQADNIINNIHNIALKTRTQHTDRAVIQGIMQIVRRTGRSKVYISCRELSELAGTCLQTTINAINRLHIPVIEKPYYGKPTKYNIEPLFTHDCNRNRHTITVIPFNSMSKYVTNSNNDVYRRPCLGKTGYKVIAFINNNINKWFICSDIVKYAGLCRMTVHRKLRKLLRLNIICRDRKRYKCISAIDDTVLNMIASQYGTYGAGDRQRQDHREKRREYQAMLRNRKPVEKKETEKEDTFGFKEVPAFLDETDVIENNIEGAKLFS